jgi:hypothetical protein
MNIELIKYAVIIALVMLITYFSRKASLKNPVETQKGITIYRLPKLYGIIGLISVGIGLIPLIVGMADFSMETLKTVIFLFLLFGGLGMLLVLMTWVHKIMISEEAIIQKNMLGKFKTVKFTEIEKIRFNIITTELIIKSSNGKIRCHENLVGFGQLVNTLVEKTNFKREEFGLK